MKVDFIIVGQGLAGTLLAYHLRQRNKKVIVFDKEEENHSSRIAAGIYNPITGRRMVKTWMADQLFPYLETCYREMEKLTNERFLYPIPVYRPFKTIKEQNEWISKSSDPEYSGFIKEIQFEPIYDEYFQNPYGGIALSPAGFVDIPGLLKAFRSYFLEKDCYRDQYFHVEDLKIEENHITYNDIEARKVIFCEGPQGMRSKFFNWLPLRLLKGEILLIRSELPENFIFNRGIFILPVGNKFFKVGATYDGENVSPEPTTKGKNFLLDKLKGIINPSFEIADHQAGIRPASGDRRPMIGIHPEFKPLAFFNGLGSKGVSLAPWFARAFSTFLDEHYPLDDAVNINRFDYPDYEIDTMN